MGVYNDVVIFIDTVNQALALGLMVIVLGTVVYFIGKLIIKVRK